MGKLNIAHHKSYHPYRRENIERVRKDEEAARRKGALEESRMTLAVRLRLCHHFPCRLFSFRIQKLAENCCEDVLAQIRTENRKTATNLESVAPRMPYAISTFLRIWNRSARIVQMTFRSLDSVKARSCNRGLGLEEKWFRKRG